MREASALAFQGRSKVLDHREELLRLLGAAAGHAPQWAAKARQPDPGYTGCSYADEQLLPLLRSRGRFIDQETVDLDDDLEKSQPKS